METTFIIEKGRPEHLSNIMEIENICFAKESFSRRQMAYLIGKAKGIFYIICNNQKVIAYISLISRANTSNLRIYSIAVHPCARGNNLGGILIEKSIEYASEMGLKSITLEVDTTNKAAIALYTKNGFQFISIKKDYYHNGDAFYMKKYL